MTVKKWVFFGHVLRQNKADDTGGAAIHKKLQECNTCNTPHMPGRWTDKLWLSHNRWILLLSISKGRFIFPHMGRQSLVGQNLLIIGALWSHAVKRHHNRYGPSWWVISPKHRPLLDNTQNLQDTDIHVPSGIWTHNSSKWAATDPCLFMAWSLGMDQ